MQKKRSSFMKKNKSFLSLRVKRSARVRYLKQKKRRLFERQALQFVVLDIHD